MAKWLPRLPMHLPATLVTRWAWLRGAALPLDKRYMPIVPKMTINTTTCGVLRFQFFPEEAVLFTLGVLGATAFMSLGLLS